METSAQVVAFLPLRIGWIALKGPDLHKFTQSRTLNSLGKEVWAML